jgi:predicted enzyme related to lactoylglutathione lyase
MTSTAVGLQGLSLVVVPTVDQVGAISFYESLGFEKRTDQAIGDQYRWVEVYLEGSGTGIALAPPPPGTELVPVQTGIILTSSDIDATHARMRELGVDVDAEIARMGDPVPPMFWFRDPTGHSLMVVG